MCRVLKVSVAGFYAWKKRKPSQGAQNRARLLEQVRAIHRRSRGTYGSPRIHRELLSLGFEVSEPTVSRIMKASGLRAKMAKKFKVTTKSSDKLPVSPNLLARDFSIETPNRVWLSDITYLWTLEGFVYLCAVMDLATRRIVGWCLSDRMTVDIVTRAFEMAIKREKPKAGAIFHSDRGSQFAAKIFRELLKSHGFRQSMSRKGDCWDNAPMESFFHTLKTEHVVFEKFLTRAQAQASVFEWVEVFYNRLRLHSALDYKAPETYFKQLQAVA
jgi:putative transposase